MKLGGGGLTDLKQLGVHAHTMQELLKAALEVGHALKGGRLGLLDDVAVEQVLDAEHTRL